MVIVVMGVTGSGKTTVGKLAAERLACPFFDADDLHSTANREKMAKGIPLGDADREPWLAELGRKLREWESAHPLSVLACSALKRSYREELGTNAEIRWVHLRGDRELIRGRLAGREGHFAGEGILEGQFRDLEEPVDALILDIRESPGTLVGRIQGMSDMVQEEKDGRKS